MKAGEPISKIFAWGNYSIKALPYSDTWADPGQQLPPAAWKGLTHPVLVDFVYHYTKGTLLRFRRKGAYPDRVQVGNEIIASGGDKSFTQWFFNSVQTHDPLSEWEFGFSTDG